MLLTNRVRNHVNKYQYELRQDILNLDEDADKALEEYTKCRWAWLQKAKKFTDTKANFELVSKPDIEALLKGCGIEAMTKETVSSVIKALMDDKFDGFSEMWDLVFNPGSDLITEKNNYIYLNTYRKAEVERLQPTPEEVELWDNFFEFIAPNTEDRLHLEQWLANCVLRPQERNQFALLLHGKSNGTGKGTIQSMLVKLVGDWNTFKPADSKEWALSRFNADIKRKTLLILDELYYDGYEVANKMKPLITEPVLDVEAKGKPLERVDNWLNVLATSNSTQPLWLDKSDRRWFVLRVEFNNPNEAGNHPDNTEQHQSVTRFRHWLETDSRAAGVCLWLLDGVSLEDWDVMKPPMTEAKKALIGNSVSIVEDVFQQLDVDELVVRRKTLFETDMLKGKVSKSRQEEWLTENGYLKVLGDKQGRAKIFEDRARDWWITPNGVLAGLHGSMTGDEITNLLPELDSNRRPTIQ